VTTAEKTGWVGQSLPRKEENRLLRGRGKFADDIKLENCPLHVRRWIDQVKDRFRRRGV